MIKRVGLLVLASLFLSSPLIAAPDKMSLSQAEQSCRQWAEEDGISRSGMEDFMFRCLEQVQKFAAQDSEEVLQTSSAEAENDYYPAKTGEKK